MKKILSISIAFLLSYSITAQTVNLKLNLEKDKLYRAKSVNDVNMTMTINGEEKSATIKITTVISLKPTGSEADNLLADASIESFDSNFSMPGMFSMEINSTQPGNFHSQNPADIMTALMNRFCKKSLKVKMTPEGKIADISNMKVVTDSVMAGLDTLKGQMVQQILSQAQSMISLTAVKGMIELLTLYLPGKEIKVGDKWESKISQSTNGMNLVTNNSLKLKKINGNEAEITGESTVEPEENSQVPADLRGLGKSTLSIDIKTGWLIKESFQTHMQGSMQGMPVEMDATAEVVAL